MQASSPAGLIVKMRWGGSPTVRYDSSSVARLPKPAWKGVEGRAVRAATLGRRSGRAVDMALPPGIVGSGPVADGRSASAAGGSRRSPAKDAVAGEAGPREIAGIDDTSFLTP